MIYYTADPHFHYAPILQIRPFQTVEEMDHTLVRNWNAAVAPEDTVYLLGDIGYNEGHVPCRLLAQLNGHKHLVRGNHDTGFEDAPLLYRYFETITDFYEIDDHGVHILLSHYPMLYDRGGYMIHGHLHRNEVPFHTVLGALPRVLNAGMDINGYCPVTLRQLIENNRIFYGKPAEERSPRPRGEQGWLPPKPDFRPIPARPAPHRKHLFLTGEKRVGKSTVLQRLLHNRDVEVRGFLTVRLRTPGGASIHMLRAGREDAYTADNRLFVKENGVFVVNPANFDRIGCGILQEMQSADIVLMDELGPAEGEAYAFQQAVLNRLDGDIPVYGVLQRGESAFLEAIKERPDVQIVTVTETNRQQLPKILLAQGW